MYYTEIDIHFETLIYFKHFELMYVYLNERVKLFIFLLLLILYIFLILIPNLKHIIAALHIVIIEKPEFTIIQCFKRTRLKIYFEH